MRHKDNELFGRDLRHLARRHRLRPFGARFDRRIAVASVLALCIVAAVAVWFPVGSPGEAPDVSDPGAGEAFAGVALAGVERAAHAAPPPPGSRRALTAPTTSVPATRPSIAVLRLRPGEPPPVEDELDGELLPGISPGADWITVKVARGDTLGRMFQRNGLSVTEAMTLAELDGDGAFNRLQVGERLRLLPSPDGQLLALELDLAPDRTLRIDRGPDGFAVTHLDRDLEERHRYLKGTVRTSLSQAAADAGLPNRQLMQLVEVFGWDVDFALDLQPGDRFTAIISERFWEGEKVADGELLAAEFVNNGRVLRAIRFQDTDGTAEYFTPEGYGLRRAFLRTPVKYARISSGFSERRYHPVLGRWRAHRGVDYAAPTGTPVMVTADGRVSRVTRERGYGNFVVVEHGGRYSTLYGHLSRFRDGLRVGDRVRQGQVIGYVGQTGLATGPHLHYEFRVNGVHKDPLTVELPKSEPIGAELREAFAAHARKWAARLDSLADDRPVAGADRRDSPGKL